MDSHEDELRSKRRREMLARRLEDAFDQRTPREAEECPDAEIIAAYAERALGADQSARWEGHFATCARCRQILLVLAASADTPLADKEVARVGDLVSVMSAPVAVAGDVPQRARPKVVDWRTRWLAPALGVAAVLAVWLAMRAPWRAPAKGANQVLIAQAPKVEAPLSTVPESADRLASSERQQDQNKPAAPSAELAARTATVPNSTAGAIVNGRAGPAAALDKVSPSGGAAANSLQAEKKLSAPSEARELSAPAALPPPPAAQNSLAKPPAPIAQAKVSSTLADTAEAQPGASANSVGRALPAASQTVTVQEEAPAIAGGAPAKQKSGSDLRTGGQSETVLTLFPQALQKEMPLLKAPSSSTLWRAGKGGNIERSTNAGQSWVPQASPSQEDWLAGTALSSKICWLVGRHGAIARTTDGVRWERISPPAGPDRSLPDWTGITAQNAQNAAISAADGRRFVTADGGKTWQQQ